MIDRYVHPTLPSVALLITEDKDDFAEIRKAINREIKPRSMIERIYVEEMTALVWDTLRFRRCKTVIINMAYRSALAHLLTNLLSEPGADPIRTDDEASELAQKWFIDAAAKRRVAELLRKSRLDESAIEAEAIRRSAPELEQVDRLLSSAESGRDKALKSIFQYRAVLALQLRELADRITDGNRELLQLESPTKRPSTAA